MTLEPRQPVTAKRGVLGVVGLGFKVLLAGERWVGWDTVEVGGRLSIFYAASFINCGRHSGSSLRWFHREFLSIENYHRNGQRVQSRNESLMEI